MLGALGMSGGASPCGYVGDFVGCVVTLHYLLHPEIQLSRMSKKQKIWGIVQQALQAQTRLSFLQKPARAWSSWGLLELAGRPGPAVHQCFRKVYGPTLF